jgi:hypothetical protein
MPFIVFGGLYAQAVRYNRNLPKHLQQAAPPMLKPAFRPKIMAEKMMAVLSGNFSTRNNRYIAIIAQSKGVDTP